MGALANAPAISDTCKICTKPVTIVVSKGAARPVIGDEARLSLDELRRSVHQHRDSVFPTLVRPWRDLLLRVSSNSSCL
jgi:hypothetical protein